MHPDSTDGLVRLLTQAAPSATPQALGVLMLREDAQFSRIAAGRATALVDAALEDGRRMADSIRRRWGNEPDLIACQCNVAVCESDVEQGWATTVVYAQYLERPARITLFRPTVARMQRGLAQPEVARIAGVEQARPMLLAHELYHHFDARRDGPPLARQHRVTVLRLGPWRWTSGVVSLAEIAAGAFAQRLLELPWHPRWFDFITLFGANPAAARRLVAALRAADVVDLAQGRPGVAQ